MKIINVQAAKTHLSRLIDEAAGGDEIVLAKAGKPLVRMVPYHPPSRSRTPGLLAGLGWEAPDCWTGNEPALDESVNGPLYHGSVEEPPNKREP
jgi:prevent-host-death family protein